MFCDRCKKNQSTIHLTEIIKDDRSEAHLCETCAKDIGLNTKLSNFSLSVTDMLSFLDVNEINTTDINIGDSNRICKTCGYTFIDFKKTGRVGCQDCYSYLSDLLAPVIASYHGEKNHIGKMPVSGSLQDEPEKELIFDDLVEKDHPAQKGDLKDRLDLAVLEERYEDAAFLRDIMKNN